MDEFKVLTNSAESLIRCGEGAFDKYASSLKGGQLFVVTDSNVFALYRRLIWETFGDSVKIEILPAGEGSKNYRNLFSILTKMLEGGMGRGCTLIALGGGVVGDIGGLAASLYMRGVNLVQIPTTLLAQVDSSVGGKTAIDLCGVKNLVGNFYQPRIVIADSLFLKTLPKKELRCGLGEIIKYSALDEEIYNTVNQNLNNLYSSEFYKKIIPMCISYKAEIVKKDERDLTGIRKCLNLGHTTGHALELFYGRRSHGEYVLIGMYFELYIAEKSGICGGQYANSLKKQIFSVINKPPVFSDIRSAAANAVHDKKNGSDGISLIVPKDIGKWAELKLPFEEYAGLLEECNSNLSGDIWG